jgi:TPP-dependent pyruvate/acetoin dehydrogenase alpha subunit
MAVVRALSDPDDAVLSNHRNHGHFLTYSGDFQGLVAEIMGREDGVCGGRGGSQHLAFRHFHSNGVQGGMTAIGAGMALARKRRGSSGIVAALIGDGTLGQGLVYEALNLAGVWNAPLLMLVENNGIAQTTLTRETIAGSIEARGAAFGLPVWRHADDDPELFAKVEAVVAAMRRSGGPGFLVLDTMRLGRTARATICAASGKWSAYGGATRSPAWARVCRRTCAEASMRARPSSSSVCGMAPRPRPRRVTRRRRATSSRVGRRCRPRPLRRPRRPK